MKEYFTNCRNIDNAVFLQMKKGFKMKKIFIFKKQGLRHLSSLVKLFLLPIRKINNVYITEKKGTIKLACVFLCVILAFGIFSSGITAYAQNSIPNYIRIGIYYGSSARSNYTVSADNGLVFGEYTGNSFNNIYEVNTSKKYHILKDSYYYKSNGSMIELSSSESQQDNVIGPYHIMIGGPFGDLNNIISSIMVYRQKGINAYPVYTGSWEIWSGFYKSMEEAQNGISEIEDILGRGSYSVIEPSSNSIVVLTQEEDVAFIYNKDTGALQVRPHDSNNPYMLKVDNSNYRGYIEIRRFWDSDMTVINILPLENYLYGVVPIEMGYSSHIEALKAQAVAARTYAVASIGKYSKWHFDLCNSTNTQVYRGFDSERQSTNQAIEETRGQVLTYNGNLVSTYYFSTSGGKTEDYINVWGNNEIPYLKSVDDSYESEKAQYRNWEVTISASKIKEYIGYDIGDIISVTATRYSESGRVIELVVKGEKGERIFRKGSCRTVFGLRSQMYTINSDKSKVHIKSASASTQSSGLDNRYILTDSGPQKSLEPNIAVIGAGNSKTVLSQKAQNYTFNGHGWGHGLGMSQEGAKGMANAGFTYEQILTHYYTGTIVQ